MIYYFLGEYFQDVNLPEKSIEYYEKACLLSNPRDYYFITSYLNLAKGYYENQKYKEARDAIQITLQYEKNSRLYNFLAKIYNRLENYDQALESLEKAIDNSTDLNEIEKIKNFKNEIKEKLKSRRNEIKG